MAVQKNFVVKNGIEVNTNLIFGDTGSNKVGIATTNPRHTLHVNGGIGVTNLTASGISTVNNLTINGRITAGSSLGASGQYLVSTGAGVSWANIPKIRLVDKQIATANQTTFSTVYTVGLLDVYINGVRLSEDEFTAINAATVTLDDACFGGETVEFISYSPSSVSVGQTGISGITVLEEGTPVGSPLLVTSINFVGASVTAVGSGIGVTVYLSDYVGGSGISSYSSTAGIASYSNIAGISTVSQGLTGTPNIEVGIVTATNVVIGGGTTQLIVTGDARVTGILTIGTSSITLNGLSNIINVGSGVTIDGNTGIISATSIVVGGTTITGGGVTSITAGSGISVDQSTGNVTITATGGGGSSQWVSTVAGIHTLSNVGIGTTVPISALDVIGAVNFDCNDGNTFTSVGIGTSIVDISTPLLSVYAPDIAINTPGGYFQTDVGTFILNSDVISLNSLFPQTFTLPTISIASSASGLPATFTLGQNIDGSGEDHLGFIYDNFGGTAGVGGTARIFTSNGDLKIVTDYNGTATGSNITIGSEDIIFTDKTETQEYARITSSGVGIGTTNPTSALTVVGSGASLSQLYVTGISTFNTSVYTNDVYVGDADRIFFGNNANLTIGYETGNGESLIRNQTSSPLIVDLASNNSSTLTVRAGFGNTLAYVSRTNVQLYESFNKKFETIGAGVTVTGTTFTNQLSVSGVSTFAGIITSTKTGDNGATFNSTAGQAYVVLNSDTNFTSFLDFKENGTLKGNIAYSPTGSGALEINSASDRNIVIATGGGNVGIGTTNSTSKLTVRDGDISVGVSTAHGVILTSPNGTQYRLIVDDSGTLSTVAV